MYERFVLTLASVYGMTAVILGAFGAHALKGKLSPESLVSYETGVRYQLVHAVVLLVVVLWQRTSPSPLLVWSGGCMAVGTLLFSGSIYLLATRAITGLEWGKVLGPVTPLGGLFLIIGWLLLVVWAVAHARAS